MLSYAMLCYATLCYAMLRYAMLCYAVLKGAYKERRQREDSSIRSCIRHGNRMEACLKVLSHDQQDLFGCLEGSRVVDASYEHATCHRQIEGVVGRLEGYNAHVVVHCELGQVCRARRGCGQIQQLPMGGLMCCLQGISTHSNE